MRKIVALYFRVKRTAIAADVMVAVENALDTNGWGPIRQIIGAQEYVTGGGPTVDQEALYRIYRLAKHSSPNIRRIAKKALDEGNYWRRRKILKETR